MNAIVSSILAIFLRDYDHFCLGNLIASSRDYDHLICFCFAKVLDMQTWPILEGNKRDYPRGASVNYVLIFMHLSLH